MPKRISSVLRYALKTIRHKSLVFKYGLRTRAPLWRLLMHDWTKFTPSELPFYANRFFGANDDPLGFAQAWNHHHKYNRHHWEHWIPTTSHILSPMPAGMPLPMPEPIIREMVADWLAASIAYTGQHPATLADWEWFHKERQQMLLHDQTEAVLQRVLSEYFARHQKIVSPSSLHA